MQFGCVARHHRIQLTQNKAKRHMMLKAAAAAVSAVANSVIFCSVKSLWLEPTKVILSGPSKSCYLVLQQ